MSKTSKHLRDCPAAGRAITSRECGEGRQTQFQCPEDCPHNPFSAANYDQFGEIEGRFIVKALDFFERENRGDSALLENYRAAKKRGIGDSTAFGLWQCFWRRDAAGLTMSERWEQRRFDGLGNDERVVFAGHRRARPALVEIRRILDDTVVEGIDLFSGAPIRIADRSLARTAVRFAVMFTWLAPLPHFHRFLGLAAVVPEVGSLTPMEILLDTARQLGAPEEPEPRLHWLAEHWVDVLHAFEEVRKALRHAMFTQMDGKYYRTDYQLTKDVARLRGKLDKLPAVKSEPPSDEERDAGFTESFLWLESASPENTAQPEFPGLTDAAKSLPGIRVIGRVLLGAETVRLLASSTACHAQLRPQFERLAAGLTEFHAEKVDDLAAQVLGSSSYDATVVPPHFLAHAPRIQMATSHLEEEPADDVKTAEANLIRQHRERWLDNPISMLDGRTPREAAAIPALRARLLHLVKGLVTKADRESAASSEQATQLIATLGLEEIAEPTPPVRPELYEGNGDGFDDALDGEPPREPLSEREFTARVNAFMAAYPLSEFERLDADFEILADDLLEVFDSLATPLLKKHEQDFLYLALERLYFTLVPGDTERGDLDPLYFGKQMEHWLPLFANALEAGFTNPDALFAPFEECRQPLAALDAAHVLLSMEGEKRKEQIRPEAVPILLSFIAATVDALDCAVIEAR